MNPGPNQLNLSNVGGHDSDMIPRESPLLESEREGQRSSLSLNDVLFILFRHKWKIILCATVGVLAAAGIYFLVPSQYESEAKLLVRYVVDRSAVDGLDQQGKNLGSPTESAIHSEAEILNSSDLALRVAETIGPDRLLRNSGEKADISEAAQSIQKELEVTVVKGSSIISVLYKNQDPKLAKDVLQEIVKRYFDKHLEVHRSLGAFDFVRREADQLQVQLNQTEEELKQLKAKAGVTSLAEDTTALANELSKTREDLDGAESELAAQRARLEELTAGLDPKQTENIAPQPSSEIVGGYQALIARVTHLRETETELLSRYTPQNRIVKVRQAQIEEAEKQRKALEQKYPRLLGTVAATGVPQASQPDLVSEGARLRALEVRTETLQSRFKALQERATMLSETGPKIAQLERQKELEETNYKYYEASLEKARIDETLDPSRMPNISIVQAPSPPEKSKRDYLKKVLLGLVGGGVVGGLACALIIELVLDRTIKRPLELETRLRIPLLLSIPNFASEGHRLRLHDAGQDSGISVGRNGESPVEPGELLRPFCEAIRDQLSLYFQMNRMTHKPKLVAVTGLSKNAGASTLASGLAAALSDGSNSRVLFVDKPVGPKRFYDMMTEFKSSDLDYVVFDMPSLGNTSSTLLMAGFMDKVMLVVEAEKNNRDSVKRAYTQLAARANVSVIFNKSRSYGPKWLQGEI
jgi:uncharacterized protein involved in exopolysaccharide biosynthesis